MYKENSGSSNLLIAGRGRRTTAGFMKLPAVSNRWWFGDSQWRGCWREGCYQLIRTKIAIDDQKEVYTWSRTSLEVRAIR